MTIEEFNKRILEPQVRELERRLGKPAAEIIEDCDKQLEPHRAVMRWVSGETKD